MRISKTALFLLLAFVGAFPGAGEERRGVLAPENANEARLNRLQPPEKVLDVIGVRPGMTVAEIGAGRGRYAVQLSVRVGPGGRVYAEDIDAAALEHLRRRCRRWRLDNVEVILGGVTDPRLPPARLDMIWIVSSYHHFADPVALLRRARQALKAQRHIGDRRLDNDPRSGPEEQKLGRRSSVRSRAPVMFCNGSIPS